MLMVTEFGHSGIHIVQSEITQYSLWLSSYPLKKIIRNQFTFIFPVGFEQISKSENEILCMKISCPN